MRIWSSGAADSSPRLRQFSVTCVKAPSQGSRAILPPRARSLSLLPALHPAPTVETATYIRAMPSRVPRLILAPLSPFPSPIFDSDDDIKQAPAPRTEAAVGAISLAPDGTISVDSHLQVCLGSRHQAAACSWANRPPQHWHAAV